MATTENGIYYPTDGTQPADVLSDMKKMAESIDETINDNTYDDTKIKEDILKIKEEQETQNKIIEENAENIEDNATDIQDLKEENANLKAQIPKGTAAGEEISLQDSAEMELVDFNLQGNSYQQNEPTLENQSEVQAVGDNINIFDDTVETVTSTINDNGIEVPDAATNDYYKQIIIPDSKKYIMSYKKNNQSFVRMAYYNGDTFISRQYSNQNGFIFTVPDNCNKIDCRTNAGTNNGIKFTDLKIERGEVATSYSLYNQGNIEITNSNKNLLDLGQVSAKGITFNKNRITIINPTYYLYAEKCNLINNKFLSGKSLTLTLIANGNVETNNMAINMGTNKDGYRFQKYFTVGNYDNTKFVITKTLQEDEHITYINVYVPTTALPTCNLTIDLQMEINEASDFIEHKGNTYTLPIQKPMLQEDYFIKENNKWYEVHLREKRSIKDDIQNAVLSSTNNFIYVSNLLLNIAQPITNEVDANVLSNVLNHTTYNEMNAGSVDYGIGISQVGSLTIRINGLTTLEEYKNALNSKDYYYYFVLKNPTKLECTEEQTQVLEQIIADGTYKGVTHYYTNDELKPTIKITYYKDLETIINKQEQMQATLNNVQAQILELGG